MPKFRFVYFLALLVAVSFTSCGDENTTAQASQSESSSAVERTCIGVVRQYKDPNGRVMKNELRCEGNCVDGSCDIIVMQDEKGNRRSWCACNKTEELGCHIILYQPKAGTEIVFCSGEAGCGIRREVVSDGPEGLIEDLICSP